MPGTPIKMLENFLDYCAVKNQVISKNIANIGTKDYKSENVVFKDVLNSNMDSLKTTDSMHISNISDPEEKDFKIVTDNSTDNVSGVNNVDIDKQMADLAANSLNFKFASNRLAEYFKNIQMVIKGSS